jgi:hypothetical protein
MFSVSYEPIIPNHSPQTLQVSPRRENLRQLAPGDELALEVAAQLVFRPRLAGDGRDECTRQSEISRSLVSFLGGRGYLDLGWGSLYRALSQTAGLSADTGLGGRAVWSGSQVEVCKRQKLPRENRKVLVVIFGALLTWRVCGECLRTMGAYQDRSFYEARRHELLQPRTGRPLRVAEKGRVLEWSLSTCPQKWG